MEEVTCKVVNTEDNEIGLEVVGKTTDVTTEREQKIKEVARALYETLEKQFDSIPKELTADEIVTILNKDECLRAEVLDKLLSDETKKQMIDNYLEDADVDELDEDFFERVGTAYVENNASDIMRDAYNNLSSWEQKEFIKDCIDDL